jgi:hypothetical protein
MWRKSVKRTEQKTLESSFSSLFYLKKKNRDGMSYYSFLSFDFHELVETSTTLKRLVILRRCRTISNKNQFITSLRSDATMKKQGRQNHLFEKFHTK